VFGGNNTKGPIDVATACRAHGRSHNDFESETFVATIQERATSENPAAGPDGAGFRTDGQAYTLEARSVPQAVAFTCKDYGNDAQEDLSPTLRAGATYGANGGVMPAVAFDLRGRDDGSQFEGPHDTANIRAGSGGSSRSYVAASAVRRLTPRECERLQGFPDDHTRIDWPGWRDMDADETPDQCREDGLEVRQTKSGKWRVRDVDGPRYKALGNSMAVPVMRWIGERIQAVEAPAPERRAALKAAPHDRPEPQQRRHAAEAPTAANGRSGRASSRPPR
jgi:DNA (cytosine-5)-methyltransferase 1